MDTFQRVTVKDAARIAELTLGNSPDVHLVDLAVMRAIEGFASTVTAGSTYREAYAVMYVDYVRTLLLHLP